MSTELFSLAMNEISDCYIEEALTYQAHAKYYRAKSMLRIALVACLAVIMVLSTALVVSAELREIVFSWIKEQYGTFTHYEYREEEDTVKPDISISETFVPYYMAEVPSGYTEITNECDEEIGMQLVVCRNEDNGKQFIFTASSIGNAYVETEGYTIQLVEVAGVTGELYVPDDTTKDSCLVWTKENMFFYISGFFTQEEMVYYAECFQPVLETEDVQNKNINPKTYRLGYIPEGYTYYGNSDTPSHNAAIYVNDEGHALSFYCITEPEGSAMTIIHKDHTHATATVHGVEADLQISNIPDEDSSSITWEEDGVLFYLAAYLPEDELIALAESVEEIPSTELEEES
ncbi:MAG: DUF4367 domain-containing protein [Bacteroidales bacterium]|nr:DUF4367 domain-containing protein [Bacteroidales bacterium]